MARPPVPPGASLPWRVPTAPSSARVDPDRDDGPRWRTLPDGRRWHACHGPIDLVIEVDGTPAERAAAARAARAALAPLLVALAGELPELRRVPDERPCRLRGAVAVRMLAAVTPHHASGLTPMAAVAGAVADHVLGAMLGAATLRRAYVNNGGDIALRLASGESFRLGLCADPDGGRRGGVVEFGSDSGIGGVATSGWRGRSHSLGIADAVTVLAPCAAVADAAATAIANAVDLPGSRAVERVAARELDPDSDLGDRLVTTNVAVLDERARERALAAGVARARDCLARGLILGARLELQSSAVALGGARFTLAGDPHEIGSRSRPAIGEALW